MNLSKVPIPRTAGILERDHLVGRLGEWSDRKLVIIHAQAGQGKSTLAAEYAASLPTPPVWYTMNAEDEDPAVFLTGLEQALQAGLREQAPKVPPVPRSRYGINGVDLKAVTGWIERLFGAITRPCLVVFDDYHIPAASPALRLVTKALLETTPSSIRFLLLSRTRPELDIKRSSGRGGGFALALPDYNQALHHLNGRLLPFGVFKLLWHKRKMNGARILTLGLKPGFRRMGIDAMLYLRLGGKRRQRTAIRSWNARGFSKTTGRCGAGWSVWARNCIKHTESMKRSCRIHNLGIALYESSNAATTESRHGIPSASL